MSVVSATGVCTQFTTLIKVAPMGARLAAGVAALVVMLLVPAGAAELTGTWQGTVTSNGQTAEFAAAFSDEGYLLFEYTNNKGLVRTVELSAPQRIQFVPPGGGVSTVDVKSVIKRPRGITYVIEAGFEGSSGGYSDQRYLSEQHEYTLTNEGLHVQVVSKSTTYFGDQRRLTGGPLDAEISEGVLTKVQ
jgi:hypothetical protein